MSHQTHIKNCPDCGATFIGGNRAARCNRCAYERKQKQAREAARRSHAKGKAEYAAMLRLTGTREHEGDCIE